MSTIWLFGIDFNIINCLNLILLDDMNSFFQIPKGLIYMLFNLFFSVFAWISYVVSHLMMVLASPRSFISNSYASWLFNHFNLFYLCKSNARLSIYTYIIMNILFYWYTRMFEFILVDLKPIFWNNLINILF